MMFESPNASNNSTIFEATTIRDNLRKLGIAVGKLSVNPTIQGMGAANSIPEDEFESYEFEPTQKLNISITISGWGEEMDIQVAGIRKQFKSYGLVDGLKNLLAQWGCRWPDAIIMNLPGVKQAINDAVFKVLGTTVLY